MEKLELLLSAIGAVSTLCTVLGAVLPPHWRVTAQLAKVGTDLRGLLRK